MKDMLSKKLESISENSKDIQMLDPQEETKLREWLADFFITYPGNSASSEQRRRYHMAMQALSVLETDAVLQSAGIRRALKYGDITALIASGVEAAGFLLEAKGICVSYTPPAECVYSSADPRLLYLSLGRLIGTAAKSGSKQIDIIVSMKKSSLTVTVTAGESFENVTGYTRTAALLQEVARIHGGSAAISGMTAGFSVRRDLNGAVSLFVAPSPVEILSDTLSPLLIGIGF